MAFHIGPPDASASRRINLHVTEADLVGAALYMSVGRESSQINGNRILLELKLDFSKTASSYIRALIYTKLTL
ncbi:hypothetical protein Pyn_27254 [Prunus yedoensis var. nudiflora]|uniref:Uncharacterized protein n=1 Tax=Prunus yedoensis var. nudiflora TaxID=2094558 RepID=A0A314XVP9_PRUYE|nr:hypothetical protein Pyn_27254 [Prunus yedoensis var. nudiflora]